ncbi:VWA domain-containing protein [bacterium]|nr:VWA domain-containing protein [candidate division CSSED10-310 bacterium]
MKKTTVIAAAPPDALPEGTHKIHKKPLKDYTIALNTPQVHYERVPLIHNTKELMRKSRRMFLGFLNSFRKRSTIGGRGSFSRKKVLTRSTGRMVRTVHYRPGDTVPAPVPSLLNAVLHGDCEAGKIPYRIDTSRLLGWQRLEHESLTLILLVDISRSTYAFMSIFAAILGSLTEHFQRNNDRIGLISLQGVKAKILNHPTRNHRIVLRNLTSLGIQGLTPLADGLLKALDMARLESFRKPGARSIVVMLSDCYPEPITHCYEDLMDEPVYQQAIRVATLYRKVAVSLLVINPSFPLEQKRKPLKPGPRLALQIIRASGGKLLKIPVEQHLTDGKREVKSLDQSVNRILRLIDSSFSGRPAGKDVDSFIVS